MRECKTGHLFRTGAFHKGRLGSSFDNGPHKVKFGEGKIRVVPGQFEKELHPLRLVRGAQIPCDGGTLGPGSRTSTLFRDRPPVSEDGAINYIGIWNAP